MGKFLKSRAAVLCVGAFMLGLIIFGGGRIQKVDVPALKTEPGFR